MRGGGSITTRLIALTTFCAVVITGLGMLVDYRLSRDQILTRLHLESQAATDAVVIDLDNWLDGIEGSTLFLARVLQQRDYSPAGLEQLLRDIVENEADIFGAAIALAPDQTDSPLGFAPYYFYRDGKLVHVSLAREGDNYPTQSWYTDTVTAGMPLWIEPYFDEAGGKVLMTTFAVPVYRRDDAGTQYLFAVVTADVALAELHHYLQRLRQGSSSFGVLLSRSGIILSSPNPDNIMRHFSETAVDGPDRTSWQEMFDAALNGQLITRQLACQDMPGQCVMRLGTLESTGWPVGVVYSEDEMTAPLREYQVKIAGSGLLTLLMMALAVVVVTRRLTRPLSALALATDSIARGELDAPLPEATGGDEVARLVHSFSAMKRDLKGHIADLEVATARRSRLEGELNAAREIQMAMLPHGGEASEQEAAYALWARVRPARSVGGDLYSYSLLGRSLFIAVGDVSDKGVPAALFMARAISLIQQLAAKAADPAAAMASVNNALASGNDNCMFVTLFLGVLDLDNLQLRFCSAGHTPPSLVRNNKVMAIKQEQGPALGLAEQLEYALTTVQLQLGDRLAVFTDGIDEAFNGREEMFGLDRFNRELLASRTQPIAAAGASLFQAIDSFAGDTAQSDDITLLLLDLPDSAPGEAAGTLQLSRDFSPGPELISRVQFWLAEALAPLPVPEESRGELMLVLEEIVSNVDKYARLPVGATIGVSVEAKPEQIALEVSDRGIAFNPLAQAERATLGSTTEEAEIGGLGVHLLTTLSDRQSYRREDGCNILQVIKLLANPQDNGL